MRKRLSGGLIAAAIGVALTLTPGTAMAADGGLTCTTDAWDVGTCATTTDPAPLDLGTVLPPDGEYRYMSACPYTEFYRYNRIHGSALQAPGQIVYGEAGVTLQITETQGTTTTGTVGGSGKFSISAIVIGAEASVNGSIAWAKTSTLTRGGTWKVPDNVSVGWLADGARSQRMQWVHWKLNPNCTTTVIGSGSTNLPNQAPYIFHN